MERLSAPERTREELRALMNGELGTAAGRGELVRLALRLIVEEALEGEVSDALGRERYERGEDGKAGYRNGYRPGKMKTAEGAVDYSAPQVRDTPEPFVSNVRAALSGRTRELERLAVELYARGLSTRDIEDAFTDETGQRLLSRAAVSEITQKLWAEYEDFCKRDLSEHAVAYLFIDGIAERLRPGQRREAVLAAWGIGEDGRKSLLGLMAGSKEDVETVRAFFQNLRARGLGDPLLVVSDGRLGSSGRSRNASPLGAPALSGASDAQPRSEGLGRSLARIQGAGHRLLSGAVEDDRAPTGGRHPRRLRQRPAQCARLFRGRFRGLHRAPAPAGHASSFRKDDEPPRTAVRRGTAAAENHSQRLRREAGAQAHVRRAHPSRRTMVGLRFTEFELRQIAAVRTELDDEYHASITPLARSAQPRVSSKSKP